MSDKMRDDAIREVARNHAGDEYFNADRAYLLVSPYSGRIFDAGFDRGWQAAQSERVPSPSCRDCANRGRVNGMSQESYCDSCVWQGQSFRVNHYAPQQKKEGE